MKYLEDEEILLRKTASLENDLLLKDEEIDQYVEMCLKNPEEVWLDFEEPTEEIFYFINQFNDEKHGIFYLILAGLVFDDGPSFVLWHTTTQNEEMLSFYRTGQNLQNAATQSLTPSEVTTSSERGPSSNFPQKEKVSEEIVLDPNELEVIEGRRATLLSKLLSERSQDDIPVEFFGQYESFVQNTIGGPDEIYRYIEHSGEILFTYIKSFLVDNKSFFYIVVCLNIQSDMDAGEETLIPLISFPSIDGELYNKYKKGEKISGLLKS